MAAIKPQQADDQDGMDKLFRAGVTIDSILNEDAYAVGLQLFTYQQAYESMLMAGKGISVPMSDQAIHAAFNALLTGMVGNTFYERNHTVILWQLKRDIVTMQLSIPDDGLNKTAVYLNVFNRYAVLDLIVGIVRQRDPDSLSKFTQARQTYLLAMMEAGANSGGSTG